MNDNATYLVLLECPWSGSLIYCTLKQLHYFLQAAGFQLLQSRKLCEAVCIVNILLYNSNFYLKNSLNKEYENAGTFNYMYMGYSFNFDLHPLKYVRFVKLVRQSLLFKG